MLDEQKLQERRNYIGGSDVCAVLGRDGYRTPLDIYCEKVDGIFKREENPYLENGSDKEPENREKFAKITGLQVLTVNSAKYHPKYPFLAGNVDGLIYGDSDKKESPIAILEVKCVSFYGRKNWGASIPIPELSMNRKYQSPYARKGFEQPDGYIPERYIYQALLYAAVYELPIVYFAVDFGMDQYLCTYKYERNLELEKLVIDQLVYFWTQHIEKQIPPEPKNLDDVKLLYPEAKKKTQVIASDEIENVYFKAKDLKNQIDSLDNEFSTLKVKMADFMGKNEILVDHTGNKLARYNNVKAKGKFDRTRLLKEYEEIHNKYWKPGNPDKPSRSFTPLFE
jgi:putative phage-type endonuclease